MEFVLTVSQFILPNKNDLPIFNQENIEDYIILDFNNVVFSEGEYYIAKDYLQELYKETFFDNLDNEKIHEFEILENPYTDKERENYKKTKKSFFSKFTRKK
ncbi:hypothetical protein GVAV_001625 [Gurleya vavrai]